MELFEIVDDNGNVIGTAPRNMCHGDPSLVHRAAHVLLFNSEGKLLLQLRSKDKDIQPGKWDTSVGGHLAVGETYEVAATREMEEELGITGVKLNYLYDYHLRNAVESENIRSFYVIYDGAVKHQPEEIDEVRWWGLKDVRDTLGSGIFTPNFEEEFGLYEKWKHGTCV